MLVVSPGFQEAACEKGILEQSEITLVSLTDTTVQDQETTITDEEGISEDKQADEVINEGQRGQEMEVNVQVTVNYQLYMLMQQQESL